MLNREPQDLIGKHILGFSGARQEYVSFGLRADFREPGRRLGADVATAVFPLSPQPLEAAVRSPAAYRRGFCFCRCCEVAQREGSLATSEDRVSIATDSVAAQPDGTPWNFKINMTLPEHSSLIAEK